MKRRAKPVGLKVLYYMCRLLEWKLVANLRISSPRETRSNWRLQVSVRTFVDSYSRHEFGAQEKNKGNETNENAC